LGGPAEGAEVDLEKSAQIKWNWESVIGAKEYKFRLYRIDDENKEELVYEDSLKGNLKERSGLPEGHYKYVVSAVDSFGRESRPTTRNFNVVYGQPLDAPDFEMDGVQ
jgi:predicted phage tail protein